MPSLLHEVIVELFRSRGEIAAELLECCGLAIPHTRAELGSIDLSQVAPAEYRADVVVILRDDDGRAVTGVIVEVQRQIDMKKRLSWPVYVTSLRATHACPIVLLVIAPEAPVAAWARAPIELGWPASRVTPVAIGFEDVPWIRDRAEAARSPELAVLSAIAHPDLAVATAAIHAISHLLGGQRQLYFDVVMAALPATVRQLLETQMIEGYKYQSEFAQRYYGAGEAAGVQKGLREAVVVLLRSKLDAITDAEVSALETVTGEDTLTELLRELAIAKDPVGARTVLDRALGAARPQR